MIQQANSTFDSGEEARLLREADRLLNEIVQRYPDSAIAVQLITNQFIGDFDVFEFRNRVRALICNDAQSTACFLFRIENLLPPVEYPVSTPRWDWLSLAVAYHLNGASDKAREIIAPFVSALRRGAASSSSDAQEQDLFVARALALTGQTETALQITRSIADCSTRIYNLTDVAEIATWRGDKDLAAALTTEAQKYLQANNCSWELGLVVQSLLRVGREAEARTLFLNTVEQQFSRFRETKQECCPAELAVAAADLGEVNLALGLLRTVHEDSPWTVPAVLGRLQARGEDFPDLRLSGAGAGSRCPGGNPVGIHRRRHPARRPDSRSAMDETAEPDRRRSGQSKAHGAGATGKGGEADFRRRALARHHGPGDHGGRPEQRLRPAGYRCAAAGGPGKDRKRPADAGLRTGRSGF